MSYFLFHTLPHSFFLFLQFQNSLLSEILLCHHPSIVLACHQFSSSSAILVLLPLPFACCCHCFGFGSILSSSLFHYHLPPSPSSSSPTPNAFVITRKIRVDDGCHCYALMTTLFHRFPQPPPSCRRMKTWHYRAHKEHSVDLSFIPCLIAPYSSSSSFIGSLAHRSIPESSLFSLRFCVAIIC